MSDTDWYSSFFKYVGYINFYNSQNDCLTSCIFAEYSKDLPTYLKYCRDVVFDGSKERSYDNYEKQRMIEILRNFYQNEKVIEDLD